MKSAIIALLLLTSAASYALDLGNQAAVKAPSTYPPNVPVAPRQGGDLIATALLIPSLPYSDTGTTTGYNNDYDEMCPYDDSTAPDVVYKYVATTTISASFDLCGSAYDTKIYIWDAALNLIACNDDFYDGPPCGTWVSKLENVALNAGTTYYLVIDGYGDAHGDYTLAIDLFEPCVLDCPAYWDEEGEPPLVPNYVDYYNGGCNTAPSYPFQVYYGHYDGTGRLCGVAGWFAANGASSRDTDWYIVTMGWGAIDIFFDAEQPSYLFELGPQDCNAVAVVQQTTGGPCNPGFMSITGYNPGADVWIWVGSTVFTPPPGGDNSYDYLLTFDGLYGIVATEPTTWGSVKSLYR